MPRSKFFAQSRLHSQRKETGGCGNAPRAAVLSVLQRGAATADEICLATGLAAGRVSELVLTLRLEGVLVTHPSGRLEIHKQLI